MAEEEWNGSSLRSDLISLDLDFFTEYVDSQHNFLDPLLKVLLERDEDKYNVALFIEIQAVNLVSSVADVEHIFATFKNVFKDSEAILGGQCLVSMTTVLLQAFESLEEQDIEIILTEHTELLWSLLKQTNNSSNVHVRAIAASCLMELELCFPQILKNCVDVLYTLAVAETSVAHQTYMSLLALVIHHSLDDGNTIALWDKHPCTQWQGSLVPQELSGTSIGYPDLKEMVSFLVDQMPLCSTEGVAWIAMQIAAMMLHRPELQKAAQVLRPLALQFRHSYCPLACHVVLLIEKWLGSQVLQDMDRAQLLVQFFLNSWHPSHPASVRLLYMDWIQDYLTRRPDNARHIPDVTRLLPGSFDGPETLLKKMTMLSSLLKCRQGKSKVLLHGLAIVQQQLKCSPSSKLKSVLVKILYRILCDHRDSKISSHIPRLVVSVTAEDVLFIPLALNFIKESPNSLPVLSSLVSVFTQPESLATLATFHLVLDVFLSAVEHDYSICQPQAMLNYLLRYVVSEDVCCLLSWLLAHKILSLCYKLMRLHDTAHFFHELSEVLSTFSSNCEDTDVKDRAHIYHSVLISLSNKKLKQALVSPKRSLASENAFHSTASMRRLEEQILILKKHHPLVQETCETLECSGNLMELYTGHFQKPLVIRAELKITEMFRSDKQPIQALALFFSASEAWGRIEPVMIGQFEEDACDIEMNCFLHRACPATVLVSAEFSLQDIWYSCTLPPFKLEFADLFQPLPVSSQRRKDLFHILWQEHSKVLSSYTLHIHRDKLEHKVHNELHAYAILPEEGDDVHLIGIYLSPGSHLVIKLRIKEENSVASMATDDINILAHANSYFNSWQ